jgi:hypothetical protein
MWLLGFAFAAGWLESTVIAAHLPRILQSAGTSAKTLPRDDKNQGLNDPIIYSASMPRIIR